LFSPQLSQMRFAICPSVLVVSYGGEFWPSCAQRRRVTMA
jgi:hypothetical protein